MRDLFAHINGEWLENHEIPADRGVDGNFYVLRDLSEERCRELIEADQGRAGTMYKAFMDEEAIEAKGLSALSEDLAALEVSTVEEFAAALGAGYRYGITSPVGYYVEKDSKSLEVKVYLYQGGLSLPDEAYYREEGHKEIVSKFKAHLERMLQLGGFATAEDAASKAERILALETDIAAGHWTVTETRDALKTFNPMGFAELPAVVQTLLVASKLPEADLVNMTPSYVEHLAGLLTPERLEDWKLWAKWQVLRCRAAVLPAEISKANFDFYGTELQGSTEQRDRWKRGVSMAESAVAQEIGQLYVEKYFPAAHKDAMLELVDYLIKAYHERINNLPWMSAETRARALEKLAKFLPLIGYPDTWRDYSGLNFGTDLMANVRAAAAFNHDHEVAKIGKVADRTEWFCPPQMVNAFYNPVVNTITFPAAILQAPFFDPEASPAANFGGIGAVIGHEIGHGFDDQGSQYDGDGNLNSWWTEEDRAGFEKLTSKLVAQFEGLVPTVIAEQGQENPPSVNGAFTLGENIGDLGGLGIAIVALRLYLGREPEVEELQDLFFNWARVWRTKIRPQLAAQYLAMDPHSPAEFRCNVIAGNIPEFYEVFEVDPEGPCFVEEDKRVTIW
ncbi:MAG: M13-type metalloendopeptidase [Corynebacterium sp.]|nr:M13-type metalloendopeptidase [Corynebacterium sp.]